MHALSQVNPSDPFKQALDSRIASYNATLLPSLPLALAAGDAIVKGVSLPDTPPIDHAVALRAAVVVTIVASPLPQDAFRPPYFGTAKARSTYTIPRGVSTLLVGLLPNVTATSFAPNDTWIPQRCVVLPRRTLRRVIFMADVERLLMNIVAQ